MNCCCSRTFQNCGTCRAWWAYCPRGPVQGPDDALAKCSAPPLPTVDAQLFADLLEFVAHCPWVEACCPPCHLPGTQEFALMELVALHWVCAAFCSGPVAL
eukprot:Polyplicarium_translucidae@DN3051_c4_g4_i1.p3